MGTWFTETSWPPIMILAAAAGWGAALFLTTQRTKYLLALVPLLLLLPPIYYIEQQVVTERERVEAAVYAVVDAFERHDRAAVIGHFSERATAMRELANAALDNIEPIGDLRVTNVSVVTSNENSRAVSRFYANGRVSVLSVGDVGHATSRWELTWQREGGNWRIVNVQRLDPVTGEAMDLWTASERSLH